MLPSFLNNLSLSLSHHTSSRGLGVASPSPASGSDSKPQFSMGITALRTSTTSVNSPAASGSGAAPLFSPPKETSLCLGDGFSSVTITTTNAPEVAEEKEEALFKGSGRLAGQPMPPPPPPEGRAGNIYVYLVSFLLFVAVITGGAFFVLYIILPESEDTIWFPIAGLALVGMPWLFWTTTCLYRTVTPRQAAHGGGRRDRAPARISAAVPPATAAAAAVDDAPVDSPGGRGRVRFGAAIVMEGTPEVPGGGGGDGGGCPPGTASRKAEGGDGSSHATYRSQEDGSLTSYDSEMPLFLTS